MIHGGHGRGPAAQVRLRGAAEVELASSAETPAPPPPALAAGSCAAPLTRSRGRWAAAAAARAAPLPPAATCPAWSAPATRCCAGSCAAPMCRRCCSSSVRCAALPGRLACPSLPPGPPPPAQGRPLAAHPPSSGGAPASQPSPPHPPHPPHPPQVDMPSSQEWEARCLQSIASWYPLLKERRSAEALGRQALEDLELFRFSSSSCLGAASASSASCRTGGGWSCARARVSSDGPPAGAVP
jgi:hypothetical protein